MVLVVALAYEETVFLVLIVFPIYQGQEGTPHE
jgi:hypothetical protein